MAKKKKPVKATEILNQIVKNSNTAPKKSGTGVSKNTVANIMPTKSKPKPKAPSGSINQSPNIPLNQKARVNTQPKPSVIEWLKNKDIGGTINNRLDEVGNNITKEIPKRVTQAGVRAYNNIVVPTVKGRIADAKANNDLIIKNTTKTKEEMKAEGKKNRNAVVETAKAISQMEILKQPENIKHMYDDGFQASDLLEGFKAGHSTNVDALKNITKGAGKTLDSLNDELGYLVAKGKYIIGDDKGAKETVDRITNDKDQTKFQNWLDKKDETVANSSLGKAGQQVAQGIGQIGVNVGLNAIGGQALSYGALGLSAGGNATKEAIKDGYSLDKSLVYGGTIGAIEVATEKLSGGIGGIVGKGAIDDVVVGKVTSYINNKVAKTLVQAGAKAGGEGFEEGLAGIGQAVMDMLVLQKEKPFMELIKDQNLLDQMITASISSLILGGGSAVESLQKGTDLITGFDNKQQALVKNIEAKGVGYTGAVELVEKGFTERHYQMVEHLESEGKTSKEAIDEVKAELKDDAKYGVSKNDYKTLSVLDPSKIGVVAHKTGNKYSDGVLESGSKVYTNTTEHRSTLLALSKLAQDKQVHIEVVDTQELYDRGYITDKMIAEGKTTNGFIKISENKIIVNKDGANTILNTAIHEWLHSKENTKEHKALSEFIEKNVNAEIYATEMNELKEIYEQELKGDYKKPIAEVTLDELIPEDKAYLQSEFVSNELGNIYGSVEMINRLVNDKPGVFKKLYKNIKETLSRMVKGTQEEVYLDGVKKRFEDVYRSKKAKNKAKNEIKKSVKYSDLFYEGSNDDITISNLIHELEEEINDDTAKDMEAEALRMEKAREKEKAEERENAERKAELEAWKEERRQAGRLTPENTMTDIEKSWTPEQREAVAREIERKTEANIKDMQDSNYVEMVSVETLSYFKEYDRVEHPWKTIEEFKELKKDIIKNGYKDRLYLRVNPKTGYVVLAEGNHRLVIAKQLGIKKVPLVAYRGDGLKPSGVEGGYVNVSNLKPTHTTGGIKYYAHDMKPSELGGEFTKDGVKFSISNKPNKPNIPNKKNLQNVPNVLSNFETAKEIKKVGKEEWDYRDIISERIDNTVRTEAGEKYGFKFGIRNVRIIENGLPYRHYKGYDHKENVEIDIKNPIKQLYRAVNEAEMKFINENGYIKSNGSLNLDIENEKGYTVFKDNDPMFYLPEDGGYLLEVEVKKENEFIFDEDEYFKTPNKIPATQIKSINGVDVKYKNADKDVKFSVSPVKGVKELVAVHNVSLEKLRASMQLGGMPMVSIAVMKDSEPHEGFGDITIVFDKNAIDPDIDPRNKVYPRDIYSARIPSTVSSIPQEGKNKLLDMFENKGYPNTIRDTASDLLDLIPNLINGNETDDYIIEYMKYDMAIKLAFLGENGIRINGRKIPFSTEFTDEQLGTFYKAYKNKYGIDKGEFPDYYHTKKQLNQAENVLDELGFIKNDFRRFTLVQYYLDGLVDYNKDKVRYDYGHINREADKEIAKFKDSEYDEWVKNLYNEIKPKKLIRSNKGLLPLTLENIVEVMKGRNVEQGTMYAERLAGLSSKPFKSFAEMKKNESKLGRVGSSNFDAIVNQLNGIVTQTTREILYTKDRHHPRTIPVEELVVRMAKLDKHTGVGIKNLARQHGYMISDALAKQTKEMFLKLQEIPTFYFEAKSERVTEFKEAKYIIAEAHNLPDDVREFFKKEGVKIVELKDNEQPVDIIKGLEQEIKFSKSKDNKGRTLSKEQQEFFKDVDIRDKQGRLLTMYHGTPFGEFTKFKGDIFFFSENKQFAENYAIEKSFAQGMDAEPVVIEAYLNSKNVFDPQDYKSMEKLYNALPDKLNLGFNRNDVPKGKFLWELMGNGVSKPYFKRDLIANAKPGDRISESIYGYEHKTFVGYDEKTKEVVTLEGYDGKYINHKNEEEKAMIIKDLMEKGVHTAPLYYSPVTRDFEPKYEIMEQYRLHPYFFDGRNSIDEVLKRPSEGITATIKAKRNSMKHQKYTGADNWVMMELSSWYDENDKYQNVINVIKELGFDGIRLQEKGESNVAVFKSNQIKDVSNKKPTEDNDIRYSVSQDNKGRKLKPEQQEFYEDAETKDENGNLLTMYHGTARGDRVANYFNPERATSGAMAFFTSDLQVAQGYAKGKEDTSLAYEEDYQDYDTQFKVVVNGVETPIKKAWWKLDVQKRLEVKEKAPHVTLDDDAGEIIYDEEATRGVGNYDEYNLKLHQGNALSVLLDGWVYGGTIFGEEGRFLEVLKLVGLDNVVYKDPHYKEEKVYEVYLNIKNPFDTSKITVQDIQAIRQATRNVKMKESYEADPWDKNSVTPELFLERLTEDMANGTSHAWTSFPDFITDYLKSQGYDGVKDTGGKYSSYQHTVYIPFYPNQIKNVTNENPTDDDDIRYSITKNLKKVHIDDMTAKNISLPGVKPFSMNNSAVTDFYVSTAKLIRGQLKSGIKGGQLEVSYIENSAGMPEMIKRRSKRFMGQSIDYLIDTMGMKNYSKIERALDDIISQFSVKRGGYADVKKVEVLIDNMLSKGYTYENIYIEPNVNYLEVKQLLKEGKEHEIEAYQVMHMDIPSNIMYDKEAIINLFDPKHREDVEYYLNTYNERLEAVTKRAEEWNEIKSKEAELTKIPPVVKKTTPEEQYVELKNKKYKLNSRNKKAQAEFDKDMEILKKLEAIIPEEKRKQLLKKAELNKNAPKKVAIPPRKEAVKKPEVKKPEVKIAPPPVKPYKDVFDVKFDPTGNTPSTSHSLKLQKKQIKKNKINRLIDLQNLSLKQIDGQIAKVKAELQAKKDTTTKIYSHLAQRLINLEERRHDIIADTESKIKRVENQIEVLTEEEKARKQSRAGITKARTDKYIDLLTNEIEFKKDKLGLFYMTETMERNFIDITQTPQMAEKLYQKLVLPVQKANQKITLHKKKLTDEINAFKLNEEEAVYTMMLGEWKFNPESKMPVEYLNGYLKANQKKIDVAKVEKAVMYFRDMYDALHEAMNKKLVENGYKPVDYRKGYFPHFEDKQKSFLGQVARAIGIDINDDGLPIDIIGLTEDFQPGKRYMWFDNERTGDKTDYNILKGFDKYIDTAMDIIYQTDNIQELRAFETALRVVGSPEKARTDLNNIYSDFKNSTDGSDIQDKIDARMEQQYDKGKMKGLAVAIHRQANLLAGKQSTEDRLMEDMFGRNIYNAVNNLNKRISANMIAGNLSSALSNTVVLPIAWSQISTKSMALATNDLRMTAFKDDDFIRESTFLTNRILASQKVSRSFTDKANEVAGFLFETTDQVTSYLVVRGRYLDNIKKGMSHEMALEEADRFAGSVISARDKGSMPLIFYSKTLRPLTMFQLEVNNQVRFLFKDFLRYVPKNDKEKLFGALTMAIMKYIIGSWLTNMFLEKVVGRKIAPSPVDIALDLYDITQKDKGLGDKVVDVGERLMDDLPFVSVITGGGRVPTMAGVPKYWKEAMNSDQPAQALIKELARTTGALVLPPFGGNQVKKTIEGLWQYTKDPAGNYTKSGNLMYEADTSAWGWVQSGLFGKYAGKNAVNYFKDEQKPISEKQLQGIKDGLMTIQDIYNDRKVRKELEKEAEKTPGVAMTTEQYAKASKLGVDVKDYKEVLTELKRIEGQKEVYDVDYLGETRLNKLITEKKLDYLTLNKTLSENEKNAIAKDLTKKDIIISDYDKYESLDEYLFAQDNPSEYKMITSQTTYGTYKAIQEGVKEVRDRYEGYDTDYRKLEVWKYLKKVDLPSMSKAMIMRGYYSTFKNYDSEILNNINKLDIPGIEKIKLAQGLKFKVKDWRDFMWE